MPRRAACGFWRSPISADVAAGRARRLGEPRFAGDRVLWLEDRPEQSGRVVIVGAAAGGGVEELTPAPFDIRSRVHEYGGGAWTTYRDSLAFVHAGDQRVYLQSPDGEPRPLTPEVDFRFADLAPDPPRSRLLAVLEDHVQDEGEPANSLVAVSVAGGPLEALVSGADFYASPRLSPDGARLAWLEWDRPDMPWDACRLRLADLDDAGRPRRARTVAGGGDESICQPEWAPDGSLWFVSDRSGWWNLWRWRGGQVEPVVEREAEFGAPQWIFGQSLYAFESPSRAVCAFHRPSGWKLAALDLVDHKLREFDLPFSDIGGVRAAAGRAVFLGGAPDRATSLVELDLASGRWREVRPSFELDDELRRTLSPPQSLICRCADGGEIFVRFYPPKNPDFAAPSEEKPPLIVQAHGGPTSQASRSLDLRMQFFTSRGFAFADVDYRGSTGYGRAYRKALDGRWGELDVVDCVAAARFLAESGRVDPERLIIRGSSAGGFTALAALASSDLFRAGVSYYGVADLEALQEQTHKFESAYNLRLVGPYPERRDVYRQRSPLRNAERIRAPTLFFQGGRDAVVPPEQAAAMVEALRSRGVQVGYVLFDEERHGFRSAETVRRALEAELLFYNLTLLRDGVRF